MTPDAWFHLFELIFDVVIVVPLAWRALRAINRVIDVMKDFPPHRHTNGRVFYPAGMAPGKTEAIE